MIVGIPAFGGMFLLREAVSCLYQHAREPDALKIIVIDNASPTPISADDFSVPVGVARNDVNRGMFFPLQQLYESFDDPLLCLMHYDQFVEEDGWDMRVREAFASHPQLGLLGLFGWQGVTWQGKDILPVGPAESDAAAANCGSPFRRITGLCPVAVVDSCFMAFRREIVPALGIDSQIMVKHGYDKIWPFRVREAGYTVAALGIRFTHRSTNFVKTFEHAAAMQSWLNERWGSCASIETADDYAFFEGRVRFVHEYRDQKRMIPCRVLDDGRVSVE